MEEEKDKEEPEIIPEGREGVSSLDPGEQIQKLKEKLEVCRRERQDYLEQAKRFKADYLNLKREFEGERLNVVKFANEDLLRELIELADDFELAFANKTLWESVSPDWRKGVEYIYTKLLGIFRRYGVEEINPLGEKFDPHRHHSMMTIDSDRSEDDNLVVEVLQRGYFLNGRVLRPAQVKVGHFKKT